VRFSEPRAVWISPPLDHTGSKTLNQGEQLVFSRNFDGRFGKKSYYEILQKFTHLFGLHYMDERHAYCRLDERGDVEDVIRIVELPGKGGGVWHQRHHVQPRSPGRVPCPHGLRHRPHLRLHAVPAQDAVVFTEPPIPESWDPEIGLPRTLLRPMVTRLTRRLEMLA